MNLEKLSAGKIFKELKKRGNAQKAKEYQKFFKTAKGGYSEGDKFLGLAVGKIKEIAKRYRNLGLKEVEKLLLSQYHECRNAALEILKWQYKKADEKGKKAIFDLYFKNTKYINNWDLVDISAPHLVGNFLLEKDRKILYKLAKSAFLWEKRMAIMATLTFIRRNQFKDTLAIAKILLYDKHDLIQKAVGWMLREVGKRDLKAEEEFLEKYAPTMPRTMLRYAIEKFEEKKRQYYLKLKISNS